MAELVIVDDIIQQYAELEKSAHRGRQVRDRSEAVEVMPITVPTGRASGTHLTKSQTGSIRNRFRRGADMCGLPIDFESSIQSFPARIVHHKGTR